MPDESRRDLAEWIVDEEDDALLVVTADPRGRPQIAFCNRAFGRLVGLPTERLAGEPLALVRSAETDPLDFARLIRAAGDLRPLSLAIDLRAGEGSARRRLHGRPLRREQGYLIRIAPLVPALPAPVAELRPDPDGTLAQLRSDAVYRLRLQPDLGLALDWIAGTFTRLTGYRIDDIEARGGYWSLIEADDLRAVQRRAQRLLAGEPASVEYRVRTRSGSLVWLRDSGRPEWDERHELVEGALCAAQDITHERQLEERIAALQQARNALIGLSEGLVLIIDPDERLRDTGGEVPGELARRIRAAVGRPIDEAFGPELARTWRERAREVLPGWPPARFVCHAATALGGEHYQVTLAAGAAGTVLTVLRPRTAELRLVPALEAGDDGDPRLRALIESLSEPSLLLAPDFRIQHINRSALSLTGWGREHALDRFFPDLLALADESQPVLDDLARALAGTAVAASETWIRLPGGQEGRVLWSFRPLQGEAGEVVAILAQGQPLAPLHNGIGVPADDRQRLRMIIDHIADGVLTLDHEGMIVAFSRSAEAIFGYAQSEIVGHHIGKLLIPAESGADSTAQALVVALSRLPGETRAVPARRKGGELVPIEVAASEVRSRGEVLYILTVRDMTVRKQTEDTIRNLAYRDALTGLPNRLLFNDRLAQATERARRNQQMLAVMILDLDRFKLINDSLGLASGDQVLRRVGQRLTSAVRRSDTVARLGGDDFLLLLPGVNSAEGAAKVAQKLLDALMPLFPVDQQELHVGASIGIALFPHDGEDAETLIRNADTALYRAKERSRGSYQFYTTDMNATAFERLILETQLRKAIERGELMVQYQPQVRIDTGQVVGVEALVRWRHPDLGTISPAEFIPLAEETGLIMAIGQFVLSTACAQVRAWQAAGLPHLRLAVNLSGRQFQESDLVRLISDVLDETGLAPQDLELELTESSVMQDAEATIGKLEALNRLGIRLSIDDFGTGYSSLNYLKRFPIKALKIDQSFIQDITTDPNDAAIAQAIIALAESLKLRVIAEGVETAQQLEVLRRYHCDEMQGYLFSRPLPPEELADLLRSDRRMLH